jgi:hypothetical protein
MVRRLPTDRHVPANLFDPSHPAQASNENGSPAKRVPARFVSRRIIRSPESSAAISRGTVLSGVFASTSLLSQVFNPIARPNFGNRDKGPALAPPDL